MEKLILYIDNTNEDSHSIELYFSDETLLESNFSQGINQIYFNTVYESSLEIGYFNILNLELKQHLYNFYIQYIKNNENIDNIRIEYINTEDKEYIMADNSEQIETVVVKQEEIFNMKKLNLIYSSSFYKDKIVHNEGKNKKNGQQIIFLFNPLEQEDLGQKEWQL